MENFAYCAVYSDVYTDCRDFISKIWRPDNNWTFASLVLNQKMYFQK